MKKKLISLLLLLSVIVCSLSGCKKEYTVPNFTVLNQSFKSVELEDFIGKPIVINFWATWCYYCTLEMPDFDIAYNEYGKDVVFLMVNATDGVSETVARASSYISSNGYDFPIYFDTTGEAADAYGVTGFPSTFFINRKGDLVESKVGMISLEALIDGIELIK